MSENRISLRLLEHTEKSIEHFLEVFSTRVINDEASLFLGTGVSRNSGYPGWGELLAPCADELGLTLSSESDLYAVAQYYSNRYSDSELRRKMSKEINRIPLSTPLLDELLDVGFTSIWTTNYDKLVEHGLEKRFTSYNAIFSDKNLASIDKHDKVSIYKIHGDISDPQNMVLTKSDYERYEKDHHLFITFLKKELVANTFLFVGYSFSDNLILRCLSAINDFLGDSGNNHFAIILVDDNVPPQLEHFTDDLKKRYGINSIFTRKDGVPHIVARLNRRIREKKVFISGAYDTVPADIDLYADNLSHALVHGLFKSGYRIATGVGRRLGTFITGYAHQYLAENSISNPAKHLSMRPFPFHLSLSNNKKIQYREIMQHDCDSAIFLFGQSNSTLTKNLFQETGHFSHGVYQEFEIAKKSNHAIIPVGSTGYEAEIIWKEVKDNINLYPYLSKSIDALKNERDPNSLSELIIYVLDGISKNRRINKQ